MSSIPAKDIIYIDVDDEITAIIDKVRASKSKIVALVLPKRAATLQSIVNMKLLKKSVDDDKKHLVLITAEPGLLPLAAATELYVAKNLQTKPEIPVAQGLSPTVTDVDEDESLTDESLDKTRPIGDLAEQAGDIPTSASAAPGQMGSGVEDDIDMSEPASPTSNGSTDGDGSLTDGAPKKDKSRKVPNFNKFRLWLIIGGCLLILLIPLYIVCFKVLPSASVLVKTNSQEITASANLTLNPSASSVDTSSMTVPAQIQKIQKTFTQQAPATGQQNNGQKATGNIKFYNCSRDDLTTGTNRTIPAGTGVSANGHTFITNQDVIVQPSHFTSPVGGSCKNDQPSATIGMTAQNAGAVSNQTATNYSVAGFASITGAATDTTGGTDNITKIVQQSDIDGAKAKLDSQDNGSVKTQLQNQVTAAGYTAIAATFATNPPTVTTSVNAGAAADTVTVTEVTTFTMVGVKQTDLQKVITSSIKDQFDSSKQSVLDYGLASANFGVPTQSGNNIQLSLQTSVVVGPDLKVAQLIPQIAGKKTGDVNQIIKSTPGVTDVIVTYSPFWVTSMPHNQSKISVTIDKPQVKHN